MPKDIEKLLKDYRKKVESVSDSHVKRIILYGSYARDDFKIDSDIDVMVLVDLDDLFMKAYEDKIIDLTMSLIMSMGQILCLSFKISNILNTGKMRICFIRM